MWKTCVADCGVGAVWSVTLIVKSKTPEPVGVPEIVPEGESVRPEGSAPDWRVQVRVPFPPCAVSVVEYGVPTTAAGSTPPLGTWMKRRSAKSGEPPFVLAP